MRRGKSLAKVILFLFLFNITAVGVMANSNPIPPVEIEIDSGPEPVEVSFGDVEPGITPNQTFYGVKRLFEKVQLYLTFTPEDRALLLVEFAQKRLVEAQAMDEQGKDELAEKAVQDYVVSLLAAQDNLKDSKLDLKAINEVLGKIEILLAINLEILEDIKLKIPEVKENIDIIKENLLIIKTTLNFIEQLEGEKTEVLLEEGDKEEIEKINEQLPGQLDKAKQLDKEKGNEQIEELVNLDTIEAFKNYGIGEIRFIEIIAQKSGKTIEEIIALRETGLGWGNIAKELGLSLGSVARELQVDVLILDDELKEMEALEEVYLADNENDEERLSDILRKIRSSKDIDIKELRKDLEKAKDKIKGKEGRFEPPAFLDELLRSKWKEE